VKRLTALPRIRRAPTVHGCCGKHKPEPVKRKKPRRPEWTYRRYWRNAHRRVVA